MPMVLGGVPTNLVSRSIVIGSESGILSRLTEELELSVESTQELKRVGRVIISRGVHAQLFISIRSRELTLVERIEHGII